MKIFIFGNGNWSQKHQAILAAIPNIVFKTFDLETTPETAITLYGKPNAAIITASTENHHALTSSFLNKEIPVFCEKPICLKQWQLTDYRKFIHRQPIFMAGHQLIFDPIIQKIAERNNVRFFSSKRTGAIPRTEGAIMSLAVHDIAIAMHIFNYDEPVSIKTSGNQHSAQINIAWSKGRIADIFVQSISSAKLRHSTIVENDGIITYIDPDCWNRMDLLHDELTYFINCAQAGIYPKYNNIQQAIAVTDITMRARDILNTNK